MRRAAAVLVVALGALAAGVGDVGTAAPADAAAYRFWSYWKPTADGNAWRFSQVGAGVAVADGSVEGWRFSVSPNSASAAKPVYSAAGAFERICGSTPPQAGVARIAVVVDYGIPAHAPPGESPPGGVAVDCATVPTSPRPTGLAALGDVTSYRQKDGLVCGITGYPRSECGVIVTAPAPTPKPTPKPTPTASATSSTRPTPTGGAVGGPTTSSPGQPRPSSPAASSAPGSPSSSAAGSASTTPSTRASSADSLSTSASLTEDDSRPVESLDSVAAADSSPSGPSAPLVVGSLVVAGLGAAAVVRARRRGTP